MASVLVAMSAVSVAYTQELRPRKHPLSTYLDLRPAVAGATPQSAPSWVESFDFIQASVDPAEATTKETGLDKSKSVFRIHLRRPQDAPDHLQMRVFFEDQAAGPRPKISVWNELGEKMMSKAIGQELGLPSSDVATVNMNGVSYLEIEAPGDGSRVHGVFLAWMETTQILQPSDGQDQNLVRQPFGILPRACTHRDDSYLNGVVTARLQGSKPRVLRVGETPLATFEFELEHSPLVAVLTYEVLGAALDAPPGLTLNGGYLGASEFFLPDLADPAYRGETREAEPTMNFRYSGWLRAQKMIPAGALAAGLNKLTVKLSNTVDSVAIRSVSIQLKYHWDKLDTVLVPAPTPYETH